MCYTGTAQSFVGPDLAPGLTHVWYETETSVSGSAIAPTKTDDGTYFYYISAIDAGGCESATRTKVTLTIYALPSDVASTFDKEECHDGTTHTVSVDALADHSIVWYTDATGTTTTTAPSSDAVGTYSAYAVYKDNTTGCESATRTKVKLIIKPSPQYDKTSIVVSSSPICSGTDAVFTINGTKGDIVNYVINGALGSGVVADDGTLVVTYPGALSNVNIKILDVENTLGCLSDYSSADINATIYINPNPKFNLDITNVSCKDGSDASVEVNITTGTTPFLYTLLDYKDDLVTTATNSSPYTFTGLKAGSYKVLIEDNNGCSTLEDLIITEPSEALAASPTIVNAKCFGDNNGSIQITASGGTKPYSYVWELTSSSGSNVSSNTVSSASNLLAGEYKVIVTDANGCTAIVISEVEQSPSDLVVSATATPITIVGAGDGKIELTVSGGSTNYTYSWSGPSGYTSTLKDISGLSAGVYTVTVTDEFGCEKTASAEILESATAISVIPTVTPVKCRGESNGAITLDVSGGTPGYTYEWSDNSTITTKDRSGLSGGSYIVTVTDAFGGKKTVDINVPESAIDLTSTISGINITCNGGNNGSITLGVNGGTTPYTYKWDDGPTTQNRENLTAGVYSVIIKDDYGCETTNTFTINEPGLLVLTLDSKKDVNCYGGSDGEITVSASGGSSGYTYYYKKSSQSTYTSTNNIITGLSLGIYDIKVVDNNNCESIIEDIAISQPSAELTATSTVVNAKCFGDNNGSIQIDALGGTKPYSYVWELTSSSGSDVALNKTSSASDLLAGEYKVIVTDANGCTATVISEVEQSPSDLVVSATATPITIVGAGDGKIELTVSGGSTNYTYSWSGPSGYTSTLKDISGLSAGVYTVTVTDEFGCEKTASAEILESATAISVIPTVTPVKCRGESNGAITLDVSGGTPGYTYEWSDNSTITTKDRSGLSGGSYIVTVTDAFGGKKTVDINVPESAIDLTSTISGINITCNGGNNGSITLGVNGGTTPYTYKWDDGPTTQNRENLTAGVYSVIIKDDYGCETTNTFTINEPGLLVLTLDSKKDVNCYGGSDGEITVSASGGSSGYTYYYKKSSQSTYTSTNNIITGLSLGIYDIKVVDNNNCESIIEDIAISQPSAELTATSTVVNAKCFGDNNGSIQIDALGGTKPYSYVWELTSSSGSDVALNKTSSASDLLAGEYKVIVTDANGCTATVISEVEQSPSELIVSATATPITALGAKDGKIDLTVSGGSTNYTYSWSGPSGYTATSKDISGLSAGVYTVTVTDEFGCEKTASAEILESATAISVTPIVTPVKCRNESNGAITLDVSGGTPGYTYEWSDNSTITTKDRSGLSGGSYVVTVTDAFGGKKIVNINVPESAIDLTSTISGINVTCNGGNNGSITLEVNGGTTPYTYKWNDGSTDQNRVGLYAGNYSVLITDAYGCEQTQAIDILQPDVLVLSITSIQNANCHGSKDGSIEVLATGGSLPYIYSYKPSGSSTYLPITGNIATGLSVGFYDIKVKDANGCEHIITDISLTQPAGVLTIASSQTDINCFGDNNGSIDLVVSGGTASYNYAWELTSSSGSDISSSITSSVSNLLAGEYKIVVTDANGCSTSEDFVITEPSAALTASSIVINAKCFGDNNGSIQITASGGTEPYNYAWKLLSSSGSDVASNIISSASDLLAGEYEVIVTDANGCTITVISEVEQSPSDLIVSAIATPITALGAKDGKIDLTVSGGSTDYTYQWSGPSGYTSTSKDISGLSAGVYTVTVTDEFGCQEMAVAEVLESATAISVIPTVTPVQCRGESNGAITLDVSGGTPGYTYEWSDNSAITTKDRSGLLAGDYQVTVTDAFGGKKIVEVIVPESATDLVSSISSTPVTCNGLSDGSITLTVSGGTYPYTYKWNDGSTDQNREGLYAGNYSVLITDAYGCEQTQSIDVVQPDPLLLSITSIQNANCHGSKDGSIEVSATGGSLSYIYSYKPSGSSTYLPIIGNIATGLSVGFYDIKVEDANGCEYTITDISLTQPAEVLSIASFQTDINCFGDNNGSIDLVVSGGTASYNYAWELTSSSGSDISSSITSSVSNLLAGEYKVVVTDANGCSASEDFVITQPDAIPAPPAGHEHIVCYAGAAQSFVGPDLASGLTHVWYESLTSTAGSTIPPTKIDVGTYSYYVSAIDAGGCESQDRVEVKLIIKPSPQYDNTSLVALSSPICAGEDAVFVIQGIKDDKIGYYINTVLEQGEVSDDGTLVVTSPGALSDVHIKIINVENTQGCISDYSVSDIETTVIVNSIPEFTSNITDVSCKNGNDASIEVNVNAGLAPYLFTLIDSKDDKATTSPQASPHTFDNLKAGLYTLTVKDNNGCVSTNNITIVEPLEELKIELISQTRVSCNASNDAEVVLKTTGGTTPINITPSTTNLSAGTHTFVAEDAMVVQ